MTDTHLSPDTQAGAFRAAAATIVETCRQNGMTLPLSICAIAPNGYVVAIRTDGESRQVIIEHNSEALMRGALAIAVTDPKGTSARWDVLTDGRLTIPPESPTEAPDYFAGGVALGAGGIEIGDQR